jgi:DNA-binding transcriptional LysR family regulator
MSITMAAEDLCLTQSAVSRQVAALERMLGVKLLTRGHRSITFTPDGERFFRAADIAIQQLQDVWEALDKRNQKRPVTITSSIGVTGLWLLPRLGALHERHPDIDVRVATNNKVLDLKAEQVDLAIRYAAASSVPPTATLLFGESVVPVAHPSLGLAQKKLKDVLPDQVLLEFDDPLRPWLQWSTKLAALGLSKRRPRGFLHFNQYDQVIHAATAGRGVALGRWVLVEPLLKSGSLEALQWDSELGRSDYAYWLLLADEEPRKDVGRVAQWIREEAAAA